MHDQDPYGYALLGLAAEVVTDLERTRMANENRLRALLRSAADSDGEERGFGLHEGHREVVALRAVLDQTRSAEDMAVKTLEKRMKEHPLGSWTKDVRGVGLKQVARLLAAIGDPYVNRSTGQPRTVSALWAYSGLHTIDGVSVRRQRGVRSNWSTEAKTRAYLIAESCMKQLVKPCQFGAHVETGCRCSPYRLAYERRRMHTDLTHPDWSDGRSHNDALRIVSKTLLRDLWCASRDLRSVKP